MPTHLSARTLHRRSSVSVALLVVVAALAMAVLAPIARADDYQAQINNGTNVSRGQHRAVALLNLPGGGLCSGTLIDRMWVMTAAHCLEDVPAQTVTVRLGGIHQNRRFDETHRTRVHAVHSHWSSRNGRYDFGLVRLPGPSGIPHVARATFADDQAWQAGTDATLVGWGATDGRNRGPGVLRQGVTDLGTDARCEQRWGVLYHAGSMLCGRADGDRSDSCSGDSGGPLYVESNGVTVQMGVTSFGDPCDVSRVGVYGWVPAANSWLNKTMAAGIPRMGTRSHVWIRDAEIEHGDQAVVDGWVQRSSDGVVLAHQRVELLRQTGTGSWRTVDVKQSNRFGVATFRIVPQRDTTYAARHPGSSATRQSQSRPRTVVVTR